MSSSVHERLKGFDLKGYRFEELEFIRLLGKSQYPVWEAIDHNNNRKVAVKVFTCYKDDPHRRSSLDAQLKNEVDALVRLKAHPSVIQFFYRKLLLLFVHQPSGILYFKTEDAQNAGISDQELDPAYFNLLVMELVGGGKLDDEYFIYARKDPASACKQLAGVADGLICLHRYQIHRDIKPDNLLLDKDEGTIKLVDMGLATAVASVTSNGICGTIQYLVVRFTNNVVVKPSLRLLRSFSCEVRLRTF
jgi:serine/threonine protein kinase